MVITTKHSSIVFTSNNKQIYYARGLSEYLLVSIDFYDNDGKKMVKLCGRKLNPYSGYPSNETTSIISEVKKIEM